jgi:hypothetical protein
MIAGPSGSRRPPAGARRDRRPHLQGIRRFGQRPAAPSTRAHRRPHPATGGAIEALVIAGVLAGLAGGGLRPAPGGRCGFSRRCAKFRDRT